MAQMTPELYAELLTFLRRFYEVILLDLGTGVTAPIATSAVDHADQVVVVVTTPEWITNTKVQMALSHLRLEHATAERCRLRAPRALLRSLDVADHDPVIPSRSLESSPADNERSRET
jgi:hypothetical protein